MTPPTPAHVAKLSAHLEACEERYRQHLRTLGSRAPLQFNKWGDWDPTGRLKPDAKVHNAFSRANAAPQQP
jgi:hypothetical protein